MDALSKMDHASIKESPAEIVAHCPILSTHLPSRNLSNSNSQLMPCDSNRVIDIGQLPGDLMQNVLSHLTIHDLRSLGQVSRSWHLTVQALQKHHNTMVQTKYALESSYFGSREVYGWLGPCHETALRVIKFSPFQCGSYQDETRYVRFLAAYRAEYQRLCSIVLTFIRAARPRLNLDRHALYRVLLDWNTWQWRGHRKHPVALIPNQQDEGAPRTVILDFFPQSLLVYLVRERTLFDVDKQNERHVWARKQAFRW